MSLAMVCAGVEEAPASEGGRYRSVRDLLESWRVIQVRLFVTQGFDGIEFCRLHGWQPAADYANNDQDQAGHHPWSLGEL